MFFSWLLLYKEGKKTYNKPTAFVSRKGRIAGSLTAPDSPRRDAEEES